MPVNVDNTTVEITPLERDERVGDLERLLSRYLQQERGYLELPADKKAKVQSVFHSLGTMRFENRANLEQVAEALLQGVAPELLPYIPLALEKAASTIAAGKGVLVIYTGGTIGSAPKDPHDLESPQVVRPWNELKNAAPQMDRLGYPVDAISFVEPLDSCNVGPRHWRTMAHIIRDHYDQYEGFVILHGTDSMVYTASALSFMLLDLAKPVVLTGSQVAGIVNPRNDAHQNMITALMLANPRANRLPLIPEVIVAFGNRISRGNRCKKMDVIGYQGFYSPNYPLLGEAGEFITVERKHIRSVPDTPLQVFDQLDTNVIMLEAFPGMQHSPILANVLQDENLRGVVLKSYGAGNIPTDPPFLNLFKNFIDRGGIVVNVTSVPQGEVVMGLYETSQVLVDRGMIGGFDITPEAAMAKLMMLLGSYSDDVAMVRRLMQQSIAGEQRLSVESSSFSTSGSITTSHPRVDTGKTELRSTSDPQRIQKVMLRFVNARLDPGSLERATIRLLLNGDLTLGEFRRTRVPAGALVKDNTVGESLVFDLTERKEEFLAKVSIGRIQARQTISFGVELQGSEGASFAWASAELNIYTTE